MFNFGNIGSMISGADPTKMGGITSAMSNVVGAAGSQDQLNNEFLQRNQNIAKNLNQTNQISNAVSGIASNLGPWGMIASVGMKAGDALMKGATDDFGIVKNKGKAIAAGILNPITGIATALNQDERREAKTRFVNTEVQSNIAQSNATGEAITNSIPKYQPPGYGRQGMKFKTKFTGNGKTQF